MAPPPSRRGGRNRFRMLRQDRGEPVYQDIPAERGLDGKQTRDRCHHRDADGSRTLPNRHGGPDHGMNRSTGRRWRCTSLASTPRTTCKPLVGTQMRVAITVDHAVRHDPGRVPQP